MKPLIRCLLAFLLAGTVSAQRAPSGPGGISTAWDYVKFRLNGCVPVPGSGSRGLVLPGYTAFQAGPAAPALMPGDVVVINPSMSAGLDELRWDGFHVGYVNPRGGIDSFRLPRGTV